MSSISSVSSGASAWSNMSTSRVSRQQEMFNKVDSDGDGAVSETELKSMFSDMAEKSGKSVSGSDDAFAKFDANGDGGLDASELEDGMKSLMSPPSTMAFAESRHGQEGGGMQGMGPPPPPPDDASSTSSSSDTDFDPLDVNQDGVVSEQERAEGEIKDAIMSMLKAADTDGDQKLSSSEFDKFKDVLNTVSSNLSSSESSSSATTDDSSESFSLSSLADMVIKEYAKVSSNASVESSLGATLSLAA
jgi:EF-hand domain pair